MSDRRVHEAMVETVQERGGDAPRALYAAYEHFNREHFDGKLGVPLILIGACSSPRALGDYIGRDVHGLESRIRIAERAVRRGLPYARWVLLHEMVHAWCQEQVHDGEPAYRGHGPKFARTCNEIGARYGFQQVSAKNRKGIPDCAQWPFNVGGSAESPQEDGDDAGEREPEPPVCPRVPCLHCGKKPAKPTTGATARFCGGRCAWAWAEAETSEFGWCDAHGWSKGACRRCPATCAA